MKKTVFIATIIIAALALVSVSFAQGPYFPSGDKAASGVIYAGKCTIGGVIVVTNDGQNDCSLKCYDNATQAAGTTPFPTITCQKDLSKTCVLAGFERSAQNGIYCTLTTAGACTYGIGYRKGW